MSNCSIWHIRSYHFRSELTWEQCHWRGSSYSLKALGLEPHHHNVKCHISGYSLGGLTHLQKSSQCILRNQPTGQQFWCQTVLFDISSATTPGQSWPGSNATQEFLHIRLKLSTWNLSIIMFNVISRTLTGGWYYPFAGLQSVHYIYLPTPPFGQEMTQGPFLSGV